MDGKQLQNVVNVVAFCQWKQNQDHAAHFNARSIVSRFFHLVKPENVNCIAVQDCKNIQGSRSLHSICFISHKDVIILKPRKLAWFYSKWMDDNVDFCENKTHVKPWRLHTLEPLNVTQIQICYPFDICFHP